MEFGEKKNSTEEGDKGKREKNCFTSWSDISH
jgi:hypothetical protein